MKKVLFLLFLSLLVLPLFAREIPVSVTDKDLQTPLEGVLVAVTQGPSVKTDARGNALLVVPDPAVRIRVTVSLIGYETKKIWVDPAQKSLNLSLALAGVVEGSELVVEKDKPLKTDEKAGVSTVATSDQLQSTGSLGVIEDVMGTIKTLPGVGFTGDFNAQPSIHGGAPVETKAVLDGAEMLYPYQWGGAVSIFDPNMVDSAKLSAGLISARYGDVISGMLEINSKTPSGDSPQFDVDLSTSALGVFTQVPVGPNAGFLAGGKVTYLGLLFPLIGASGNFSDPPYIDNGYTRAYWKPTTGSEWDLSLFYGHDGVGALADSSGSGLTTKTRFDYSNMIGFGSTQFSALVDPLDQLKLSLAYNRVDMTVDMNSATNGTSTVTGSVVDNMVNTLHSDTLVTSWQASASLDHQLDLSQVVSFGVTGKLQDSDHHESSSMWGDEFSTGSPQLVDQTSTLAVAGNYELNSGAFALWEYGTPTSLLSGELGLRVDHSFLYNSELSLNTYPVANPRARLVFTPVTNAGWVSQVSFTGGTGLYSQMGLDNSLFTKSMGIKDFQLGPDRAWFSSLGVEVQTDDGWKFSVDGYGKVYFNRLYVVADNASSATNYEVHTDGTGLSAGVDVMVQKRLSRYWDGWLSYTFNDTRLRNPAQPAYPGENTVSGDPLGTDYYPSYQQFHVVHLVSDWKPVDGFSVMVDASLATGTPLQAQGPVQSYVSQFQGRPVTRYAQSSSYSDTLRAGIALPVDLKLSWFGYYPGTPVRWEWYLAVQDIFASLYTPQASSSLNPWTGQSSSSNASYGIGIPLPSFGYKLSY